MTTYHFIAGLLFSVLCRAPGALCKSAPHEAVNRFSDGGLARAPAARAVVSIAPAAATGLSRL